LEGGGAGRKLSDPGAGRARGTAGTAGAPAPSSTSIRALALYRYDALGRLDATRRAEADDIGRFLELGPLGTALMPWKRPRMLLIDEIDKSDIDLPSDLLNIIEDGTYEIPELARHPDPDIEVRLWHSKATESIHKGRVTCTEFPFIVMTSNGERTFPPPFLRRCVRFRMPEPTPAVSPASSPRTSARTSPGRPPPSCPSSRHGSPAARASPRTNSSTPSTW
jgi:MoxR-like ATPase